MPGIAGLVTQMSPRRAEAEVRRMLGVMAYEPFYSSRLWSDGELGLYVGWTARAGSFSDAGPQRNESGKVVLIFSGEEYPAPGIRQDLRQRGHGVGEDPTAYLVHQYEDDPGFPAGLNGFFHGVIADRQRRRVLLFNDRYGMHRLYVHQSKDGLYFAAEAKAILAVRPDARRIDLRGLGESLALGCVVDNRTIFQSVELLPPGSAWRCSATAAPERAVYFRPQEWEDQTPLDDRAFSQEVGDVFRRNLPRYFAGHEPVGMSLTGGLDSRMVMAWQPSPPGAVPCYSWGSVLRECQDVIVAREIARSCGMPYEVIPMGEEMLANFPHYAERAVFVTDGNVDAGLAPDIYMNRRARQIAPARMTGLYGGEVLRGVRAFKHTFPRPGLFAPELDPHFADAIATFDRVSQGLPVSFAAFRQAPWHHGNSLALEQSQISMRSPFLDNDFVKTVFRSSESARRSPDVSMRIIAAGNPALGRIRTDHGLTGRRTTSERIAYAWQRFTFRAEYAYDRGMPQSLAAIDHALRPLRLERLFLGRHKPLHFRSWYRDGLSSYLRDVLLDRTSLSRPYLQPDCVRALVEAHINGHRNYTTEIHKLLKLELLHRLFIDHGASIVDHGASITQTREVSDRPQRPTSAVPVAVD